MMKVTGGIRCGKEIVEGTRCCREHLVATRSTGKNRNKNAHTFAIKTEFEGTQAVKSSEYYDYIQSEEWTEKSRAEREKNPNCSLCNRKGVLHVHHRTYVRLGSEKDGDLVVLCEDCHKMFHKYYKYDSRVGYFVPIM